MEQMSQLRSETSLFCYLDDFILFSPETPILGPVSRELPPSLSELIDPDTPPTTTQKRKKPKKSSKKIKKKEKKGREGEPSDTNIWYTENDVPWLFDCCWKSKFNSHAII